jgi:hypothetical protein
MIRASGGLSLERTALLNEAYKTLRAPEPRAFYILRLNGLDLQKDEARAVTVPPERAGGRAAAARAAGLRAVGR